MPAPPTKPSTTGANERLPAVAGSLKLSVPKQSCRILALRKKADHPQLLSTSRHVTQGIVDVKEESWDAASRTLKGVSEVVAGDPYELRIVLPEGGAWTDAQVDAGDATVKFAQDAGCAAAHRRDADSIGTDPVERHVPEVSLKRHAGVDCRVRRFAHHQLLNSDIPHGYSPRLQVLIHRSPGPAPRSSAGRSS